MTIDTNTSGGGNTQQTTPQARTFQQGQTTQGQSRAVGGLDSLRSTPFARTSVGEKTHQLASRIKKRIEEAGGESAQSYSVQVLDNERTKSFYSVVLVTRGVRYQGKPIVACFGLLVEDSNKKLASRTFTWNNAHLSLSTAPADAIDEDLRALIVNELQNTFGRDAAIDITSIQVVPSEFAITDENARGIDGLLFNAGQALSTELVKAGIIEEPAADARLITSGGNPVIGRDLSPPEMTDNVGMPVRSDFSISLRQIQNQDQNTFKPNSVQQPDLTQIDGFVDLDYHEPQNLQHGPYAQITDPAAATRRYIPRFVITRLNVLTQAVTPELFLMGLSTVAFAGYHNAWLESFRPRVNSDEVNLRDISAIGYEVNLTGAAEPERLPLPGASDMPKFYQMLSMAIQPSLLISIDIDEAGEQSWLMRDLYAASRGQAQGIRNIIAAADRATGNLFSKMWDGSKAIAIDEQNRIALGYWIDSRGRRRDLRELDYVAMLNLVGGKDMTRLVEWSATFYNNNNDPLDVRLERRERIAKEVLPTYTLKGWARRIAINPEFIVTLANALGQAGLLPRPSETMMDLTGQTLRGNYLTSNMAMNFNNANVQYFNAAPRGPNFNGLGDATMANFGTGFGGLGR